jgi:small subunit ribosomal protein S21
MTESDAAISNLSSLLIFPPRYDKGVCPANRLSEGPQVLILVRDNNVDQALRLLKKKLQQEGVLREMRLREHFEKPSVKRAREKAEGIRRTRKLALKKLNKELGIVLAKKIKPSRSK